MTTRREGNTMADERHGALQAGAEYTLARIHAHGVADGCAAAVADSPDYLSCAVMLDTAWEVSCERPDVLPLAEQEEYFVGWVHGYVQRADLIEGTANTLEPDTWADARELGPA
jgi:hypothetical protein